jgi:hypothetical protein
MDIFLWLAALNTFKGPAAMLHVQTQLANKLFIP